MGNYGILIDLHRMRYLQMASKADNVKIITPEANQFADAWDIDYRKYHDLFIPDNKKAVIAVSLGA